MKFIETPLPGVFRVEPVVRGDARGFFMETWRNDLFREAGIDVAFVQDNASRSVRGTLRGLHFQHPHGQGKLVRVTAGAVFDVAVDVRRGSPTFGKWYGCELSESNHAQLWIPAGFAHGFCVISDHAEFAYKCTEYYHPETEQTLLWNDPDIAVAWPLHGEPLLSDKDRNGSRLVDMGSLPLFSGARDDAAGRAADDTRGKPS